MVPDLAADLALALSLADLALALSLADLAADVALPYAAARHRHDVLVGPAGRSGDGPHPVP